MLRSSTANTRQERECGNDSTHTLANWHTWFPLHHKRVRVKDVGIIVNENEAIALVIVPAGSGRGGEGAVMRKMQI